MKLREIFEAIAKTFVVAFPKNESIIGLLNLLIKLKVCPRSFIIWVRNTNTKKDPLSFDLQVRFAKASFKGIEIGNVDVRTSIDMMQKLEKLGYTDIIYVAGSDRAGSFDNLLNKYNGADYNFNKIKVVNAGERDADPDGAGELTFKNLVPIPKVKQDNLLSKGSLKITKTKKVKRYPVLKALLLIPK